MAIFDKLMAATIANDHDALLAECDAAMKAAITKPMLAAVNAQIAPRAQSGYEASYLGDLHKQGFQVQLYRLRFKAGGDDILATLSLKDGKAGGFYLK